MKTIFALTMLPCLLLFPHAVIADVPLGANRITPASQEAILSQGAVWKDKAAQVKVGMSRSEVEKLLPSSHSRWFIIDGGGGYQSWTYSLDEHWKVRIVYDYTGWLNKKDKWHGDRDGYSLMNKVLVVPMLWKHDEMPALSVGPHGLYLKNATVPEKTLPDKEKNTQKIIPTPPKVSPAPTR